MSPRLSRPKHLRRRLSLVELRLVDINFSDSKVRMTTKTSVVKEVAVEAAEAATEAAKEAAEEVAQIEVVTREPSRG